MASFMKRIYQSHIAMESFTIEMVSKTSAKIFPDNTLSSHTKFLPEQLNVEGQWEVALPKNATHQ